MIYGKVYSLNPRKDIEWRKLILDYLGSVISHQVPLIVTKELCKDVSYSLQGAGLRTYGGSVHKGQFAVHLCRP